MSRTKEASADCTVIYDRIERSLVLSFATLPMNKMVNLAQLDDPKIKECSNWEVLELRLQRVLEARLTGQRKVEPGANFGFIVRPYNDRDGHRVLDGLKQLLEEADITVTYSLDHMPPVSYR